MVNVEENKTNSMTEAQPRTNCSPEVLFHISFSPTAITQRQLLLLGNGGLSKD